MNLNILLQIVELGLTEIVPIEQLAARLISIFKLNPNVELSIQSLESDAIQADADTQQMIADWQKAHGLPVTPVSPDPAKA
jgi:hypothetical protein